MSAVNIFEQASRISLRFDSSKGLQPTEVLWTIPLLPRTNVDEFTLEDIAQRASNDLAEMGAQSFVRKSGSSDKRRDRAELRMAIIKYIIEVRQSEEDAVRLAAQRKQEADRISEIIAQKRDTALADLSLEELEARRKVLLGN
jgi:hypothetical protein